ncbi:MAG: hypothetical protein JWP13_49 [Candidatus Saccharibacteria bacterium]|nr:hypothetical protein [Candidatus Saccharibacteria bacterium]
MNTTNKLFAWQETKPGLAIIAVLDLFIAYIFVSIAIDTGSLLDYFIVIVFLALGITAAVKLIRKLISHE